MHAESVPRSKRDILVVGGDEDVDRAARRRAAQRRFDQSPHLEEIEPQRDGRIELGRQQDDRERHRRRTRQIHRPEQPVGQIADRGHRGDHHGRLPGPLASEFSTSPKVPPGKRQLAMRRLPTRPANPATARPVFRPATASIRPGASHPRGVVAGEAATSAGVSGTFCPFSTAMISTPVQSVGSAGWEMRRDTREVEAGGPNLRCKHSQALRGNSFPCTESGAASRCVCHRNIGHLQHPT